jgi:hypothetical protein
MNSTYIVVAVFVVLILLWFLQPKKSTMAVFNAKKAGEKCPDGWTELTPEICTRDA